MREYTYDSRRPLECCEPTHAQRQIGVAVGVPFQHQGTGGAYVDIRRETVAVFSRTFGKYYPVGEADGEIAESFRRTIEELERVMDELSAHRDRLVAELRQHNEAASWSPRPVKITVHRLHRWSRHGDETSVYSNYAGALAALASAVRAVAGGGDVPNTHDGLDDAEVVLAFYGGDGGSGGPDAPTCGESGDAGFEIVEHVVAGADSAESA